MTTLPNGARVAREIKERAAQFARDATESAPMERPRTGNAWILGNTWRQQPIPGEWSAAKLAAMACDGLATPHEDDPRMARAFAANHYYGPSMGYEIIRETKTLWICRGENGVESKWAKSIGYMLGTERKYRMGARELARLKDARGGE